MRYKYKPNIDFFQSRTGDAMQFPRPQPYLRSVLLFRSVIPTASKTSMQFHLGDQNLGSNLFPRDPRDNGYVASLLIRGKEINSRLGLKRPCPTIPVQAKGKRLLKVVPDR